MEKRKIAIAAFLMGMAFQYGAVLPANAWNLVIEEGKAQLLNGNYSLGDMLNKGGTLDVSGTLTTTGKFSNNGDTTVGALNTNGESNENKNSGNLTINGTANSDLQNEFDNSGLFNNNTEGNYTLNTKGFTNSGTVNNNGTIKSSGIFDNSGSINNNGNMSNDAGGKFTSSGNITNNNNFTNSGKMTLEDSGKFTNNGNFENNVNVFLESGSSFENNGNITGDSERSSKFWVDGDSTFTNNGSMEQKSVEVRGGTFTNNKDAKVDNLYATGRSESVVENNGDLTVNKKVINTNTGEIENNGDLTFGEGSSVSNKGTLNNEGMLFNNGIITNEGEDGYIYNKKGGVFTNNGTLSNATDSTIMNDGQITNNGDIVTDGLFQSVQGEVINNGNITVEKYDSEEETGGMFFAGKLTNEEGGSITSDGNMNFTGANEGDIVNKGEITSNGTMANNGYFNNSGNVNIKEKSTFQNNEYGIFSNDANGTLTNDGSITNEGDLTNNGKMTNNGSLTTQNGGNLTNSSTGELTNAGSIKGTLINDGGNVWNTKDEEKSLTGSIDAVINQNGGTFTNDSTVKDVANAGGSIFNNNDTVSGQVTNVGATVNNAGTLNNLLSLNGTVNNSGTITDNPYIGDSVLNNSGEIKGTLYGSNSTVNNMSDGTIENGLHLFDSTVNNDGTIKGDISAQVEDLTGELTLNNNNGGTLEGVTIKDGATVNNEGTLQGDVKVEKNGLLHLGTGTQFAEGAKVDMSGTLDLRDGALDDRSDNVTLQDGASLKTDVSAKTGKTDVFGTATGNVTLDDFNLIPDTLYSNSGSISKEQLKDLLGLGDEAELSIKGGVSHQVMSPLRRFSIQSTEDGITYGPTGNGYKDFNPAVMASPVAAQIGGYLNQLNSYDEAFRNMDMYMLMTKKQRKALKLRNKYAAADGNLIFDPTNTPYDESAVWIRPYATFENVPLKGGPRVSNVAYGSFFGIESELHDLGNGWDGMYGVYAGYNGSHQAYDGIGIYQNGGTLGLVGMAYKGNFFTGLTVNAGANVGEASTFYGQDNFTMLMAGIANKTGYNIELADGKFIIQPSLMLSYSFVNTFDYTNAAGIHINSDPLNAIQVEPGIKFIGNLKNGWQPYAGVSVVMNFMDKTKFQANDASLPDLSVKPFVRYGLGVRKTWGERLTGFFQTYFTNGGRNGVGFQLGFRVNLGKNGNAIKKGSVPERQKTELKLSNIR